MGAQIVGMLDEAAKMFKARVEMEYDTALLKKQQQLLDDYDEWTKKRREQLVDEMMRARENIINQVVVESLNEEPTGSYVKIYLRDYGEQSE